MRIKRRRATRCRKTGKLRYHDRIAAMIALAKVKWQGRPGHAEEREYPCEFCRGWHLTSMSKN